MSEPTNPWRAAERIDHRAEAREARLWVELVDAVPDAVIVYDADLRYVALNKAAAEIYGYDAAELIGRSRDEVVGIDEHTPRLREALRSTPPSILLSHVPGPSGQQTYETVYQRHTAADGKVYLIGVAREISAARDRRGATPTSPADAADAERKEASRDAERLRSLFESSPDGIGSVSPEGLITDINAAALAIVGLSREEVVGKPVSAFFDHADMPPILAAFERTLAGEAQTVEARPRTRQGNDTDLECTASPIFSDGKVVGVYVAVKDISARKRAERALQRQHERIRELYLCATASNVPSEEQARKTLELGCTMLGTELALIYDAQDGGAVTLSVDVRPEGEQAAGRITEALARASMATAEGLAIDDPHASELVVAGDETGLAAFIGAPVDVAGERFGALCFGSTVPREAPFEPADRDLVRLISVLIGAEIERRRARLHLRALAYYDSLTSLPNRVMLKEQLDAALAAGAENGAKTAVLFLDLDRFKDINDTIGHMLGDRLLQLAGERIVGCVRSTETVARMGGDEFIVVMPSIRETGEAIALAERLLRAIDAPFSIAGHERYTTTSIGIAIAPSDGTDSDTLIKNADIAMYRAKDRGRNTFALFTPEFDRTMSLRVSNEQGMRRALERGEFRTFYQPIVDVRAGRVHCVEALARWQHPSLSILRPDAFITSAEANGLIVRLGEIVLEDACRQVSIWHGAGFGDLRLSVNLSARQFRETQMLETLAAILERTGFPSHLLQLEITEGVAMTDPELNVGIMRELKSMGVRVVLDDFGTGYSSLGYLRRFPLDGIKIDRSFVAGIGHEPDDETIVRTVVGMAHSLGLFVVAEGVETADQVEFLRRESCEMAQGHFYSPALPAVGCERYLRAWAEFVNAG